MLRAGIIGCGNISSTYLKNGNIFPWLRITMGADIKPEASLRSSQLFGIKDVTVDELVNSPEIDVVLNLTTPQAHTEVDLNALSHGKHVYSEKPMGLDMASATEVRELAASKGLRIGCAPDTFLGGGHQLCRKLIDDGMIGRVVSGTAFMLCHGHEAWHPAPAFYYEKGGGPLFDMGPYYITALVNLLGPVARVVAVNTRSTDLRIGTKANIGKTFPVEVDTHITAILEFASGAVITLITSFDVWKHSNYKDIELYGTEGALHIPDPNCFSGDVRYFKAGLSADWMPVDNPFIYNENSRIIGLADMCAGILKNRPHRCNGDLSYHVLDVMCSIIKAGETGQSICIGTQCERPAALPLGLHYGELD